jgi:hypothetical protein
MVQTTGRFYRRTAVFVSHSLQCHSNFIIDYCTRKLITMKASTERKIIRWVHIIASIPIIGYIYGPVKNFPRAVSAIQWVLFPLIVLTGLWLWKGHWVKKWRRRRK